MNGSRYDSRAGTRGDGAYYRPRRGGFFQDLGRLARASGALLRDHALLAREEAKEEGRRVAINASMGATALPFALTALIMLSVALAVGLSGWLGVGWAFLVVGLLDLAIAGILAGLAALRLRREPSRALARTKAELAKDLEMARQVFEEAKAPPPAPRREPPTHARTFPGGGVHTTDAETEHPAEHL